MAGALLLLWRGCGGAGDKPEAGEGVGGAVPGVVDEGEDADGDECGPCVVDAGASCEGVEEEEGEECAEESAFGEEVEGLGVGVHGPGFVVGIDAVAGGGECVAHVFGAFVCEACGADAGEGMFGEHAEGGVPYPEADAAADVGAVEDAGDARAGVFPGEQE